MKLSLSASLIFLATIAAAIPAPVGLPTPFDAEANVTPANLELHGFSKRGEPACGGDYATTSCGVCCNPFPQCVTSYEIAIRRNGVTHYGDGSGNKKNNADPCNRDYGGLRLICHRDYHSTPTNEAFGVFGSLTCKKGNGPYGTTCYHKTNGLLTFLHAADFHCV